MVQPKKLVLSLCIPELLVIKHKPLVVLDMVRYSFKQLYFIYFQCLVTLLGGIYNLRELE